MNFTVYGFSKTGSISKPDSIERTDKYRIKFSSSDGQIREIDVRIVDRPLEYPLQIVEQGDLQAVVGMRVSSLVCRRLRDYINGADVSFPFVLEDTGDEAQ